MDAATATASVEKAQNDLNALIDSQAQARNKNGIRSLILASDALEATRKHLARAVEQSAPKATKAKS